MGVHREQVRDGPEIAPPASTRTTCSTPWSVEAREEERDGLVCVQHPCYVCCQERRKHITNKPLPPPRFK